ncbi:RNA polymerase, sigma subunit, ECF family [Amycolatopsis marina]|uniref:RNA polymerase sigma factor n=1 Tax=Amycolatopsis marina TaxID=490629 RepID=A0A1I0W7U9_9PSEU|nr:RNA polymerase subunit sigma-70 [Amycolatopsis marina]SFA84368.1 RNA polymerase, sigma subunit, ECF family [Amycolatopsis marina]
MPEPGLERVLGAARDGDETAFARVVNRYRGELHVHCYRMSGSFDDAEDVLQEALLKAWRARESLPEAEGVRPWLYRVVTNACIDAIRHRARRVPSLNSLGDVTWLQPYPDRLLDQAAPEATEPEAVAVSRETIGLAYLAAIQLLPTKQRAVLILREVLGCSSAETAALLEITVAAVNSALQRARARLRGAPSASPDRPSEDEESLLRRYIEAHERGDAAGLAALLAEDVRVTMPPEPVCYQGRTALEPLLDRAFGPACPGTWLLTPTRANRMPAAACYLRRTGDSRFRAFKLDVLHVEHGEIVETTTFDDRLFPAFGLPASLAGPIRRNGGETTPWSAGSVVHEQGDRRR